MTVAMVTPPRHRPPTRCCGHPGRPRRRLRARRCSSRGEVSPEAIAALRRRRLRRRRRRARGVRRRGRGRRRRVRRARPPRSSGAAAEVLTASAGLARDKGLRGGGAQEAARPATDLLDGGARGRRPVRRRLHQHGRADGRAGHRPARHRAPGRRPPGRRARARRPDARASPRSWSPRTSPRPTPPASTPRIVVALVTERGGPTSHTAIIARQLGIPCVVGVARRARRSPPGTPLLVDGDARARSSSTRTPTRPTRRVAADRAARAALLAAWTGPARTADGMPGQAAGQRRRRRVRARPAAQAPGRGRRACSAPSCASSTARTSRRSRSRPTSTPRCSAPFAATDRYVVVRTLDAGSDKPIAFATHEGEENPALGVRGLRLSFDNPGLLERQLDGDRRAPRERTGTETWVMAPMVATVAEAARVRGEGARAAGSRPA